MLSTRLCCFCGSVAVGLLIRAGGAVFEKRISLRRRKKTTEPVPAPSSFFSVAEKIFFKNHRPLGLTDPRQQTPQKQYNRVYNIALKHTFFSRKPFAVNSAPHAQKRTNPRKPHHPTISAVAQIVIVSKLIAMSNRAVFQTVPPLTQPAPQLSRFIAQG